MTTIPSIDTVARITRMASTAAPSAPSLSPRPIHREAARAAASVVRTSSRARLRSGCCWFGELMQPEDSEETAIYDECHRSPDMLRHRKRGYRLGPDDHRCRPPCPRARTAVTPVPIAAMGGGGHWFRPRRRCRPSLLRAVAPVAGRDPECRDRPAAAAPHPRRAASRRGTPALGGAPAPVGTRV